MAIVMNMHWAGVTAEQYDAVRREVGWEERRPDGGILHIARVTSDGLDVTDVWDSEAAFGAFTNDRLLPGVAKVGLSGEPAITLSPCIDVQIETQPSRARCVAVANAMPISIDMYNSLRKQVNWVDEPPVGGISHVVWADGDGLAMLDVWRSVKDCEAFSDERLLPAMVALGWPVPDGPGAPPEPVHAWYHPGG